MERGSFSESMAKHVLHFWPAPKDTEEVAEYQKWMDSIYYGVRWIEPFKFDETLKEYAINAPRFRRDVRASSILAVYNRIAESRGWRTETTPQKESYLDGLRRIMSTMGAKGALFVLEQVDAGKVSYPDEIIQELVRKAGVKT